MTTHWQQSATLDKNKIDRQNATTTPSIDKQAVCCIQVCIYWYDMCITAVCMLYVSPAAHQHNFFSQWTRTDTSRAEAQADRQTAVSCWRERQGKHARSGRHSFAVVTACCRCCSDSKYSININGTAAVCCLLSVHSLRRRGCCLLFHYVRTVNNLITSLPCECRENHTQFTPLRLVRIVLLLLLAFHLLVLLFWLFFHHMDYIHPSQ